MLKRNNRRCYTCGEVYTYCPSCQEFIYLPKWKALYDTSNCKAIWEAVVNYESKNISIEEAYNILKNCDTSINIKNSVLKEQIDYILSYGENLEGTKLTSGDLKEVSETISTTEKVVTEVEKVKTVLNTVENVESDNKKNTKKSVNVSRKNNK